MELKRKLKKGKESDVDDDTEAMKSMLLRNCPEII